MTLKTTVTIYIGLGKIYATMSAEEFNLTKIKSG